ncbi:MAG: M48 family metallopeptidase [Longimicrobiales bacterium]|nr:M48 family metallopeptidase [Longimicrobiales bacterium]
MSAATWLILTVSVIGIAYALFIAAFFFVSHLAFVAYVRGSAVKVGPRQFPQLHARVHALATEMGMEMPAVYIMQAGGTLNAFATRFLRREMVILFSDLLEACEGNDGARDMIVAHELAHLKCKHLRWMWFTLPGHFVPFLGSALSRAREYTCDRYGAAGAGDLAAARLGLVILSAGPQLAPRVDQGEFVRQRADMNTGLMTIGEWFGSHPPLSKRIAAIDPGVDETAYSPTKGRLIAVTMLILVGSLGLVTMIVGAYAFNRFSELLDRADQAVSGAVETSPAVVVHLGQVDLTTDPSMRT